MCPFGFLRRRVSWNFFLLELLEGASLHFTPVSDLQKEKILHTRKLDGIGPGVTAFLIVMT